MASLPYRKDLDGLRALAVVAVILFHLKFSFLPGGYLGVDLFFVISGYLISKIILHKYAAGTFSFKKFYLSRICRLLPASLVTVLVTWLAGFALMLPDDFALMSKSAAAAVISLSNIVFYLEAGYWDKLGDFKPLLHTWSLGVEEQFYLVWPSFIIGLTSIAPKRWILPLMAVVVCASTILMLWMSDVDRSAAFYLFPFRIFQFSAGALVGLLSLTKLWKKATQTNGMTSAILIAGLTSTLWCFFTYQDVSFPGGSALLPTFGAMLLLLAGSNQANSNWLTRRLLENRLAVWLGKISYSLYLVHWPIISLFMYKTDRSLTLADQTILFASMLPVAALLHYQIERRFYQRAGVAASSKWRTLSVSRVATATIIVTIVVASISVTGFLTNGWPGRFNNLAYSPEEIEEIVNHRYAYIQDGCEMREFRTSQNCNMDAPVQVIIIGDSHEPDGVNFFNELAKDNADINVISFGRGHVMKNPRKEKNHWICDESDGRCLNQFKSLFDPDLVNKLDLIVLSNRQPFLKSLPHLRGITKDLKTINPEIEVITIGSYLQTHTPCSKIINQTGSPDGCKKVDNVLYFPDTPEKELAFDEVIDFTDYFIDRVSLLCSKRKLKNCLVETPAGVPAFLDQSHITAEFSIYTAQLYLASHNKEFEEMIARAKEH